MSKHQLVVSVMSTCLSTKVAKLVSCVIQQFQDALIAYLQLNASCALLACISTMEVVSLRLFVKASQFITLIHNSTSVLDVCILV